MSLLTATRSVFSAGLVSQAVSVFGFAFYIQPVIMPLLEEMPVGQLGVKLTSYSTRVVVLGATWKFHCCLSVASLY